ncbi:redoxin domain-containing protein [Anaplasma platys]|uniref:Redoxin domain-containing protein n=1 Tax=Anaplasma platys TaxID=949 RepID=A0A858PX75_9RICK|nr:redoxin domain-containing protein [Anaplasma platys]
MASFALIGSINNSEQILVKRDIVIQEVNSDAELFKMVSQIGPDPTLLVLYTSWCSNCVEKMPEIIQTINEYDIKPMIISLDTSKARLASFLLEQQTINFVPYNVNSDFHAKFAYALSGRGVSFTGKIPFIVVLGDDRPPITGISSVPMLRAAIESVTTRRKSHVTY